MGHPFIFSFDLDGVKPTGPRARKAPAERRKDDAYETPPALATSVCETLKMMGVNPQRILEPSAGSGNFVRAAQLAWPSALITAVEPRPEAFALLPSGAGIEGIHQSTIEPWVAERGPLSHDLVLGNPPYSLANEHTGILLDAMKPKAVLAFLLRVNWLAGAERMALFARHPILALWPVVPRPSFTDDGQSDRTEYGIFVFRKGERRNAAVFAPVTWEK